MPISRSADTAPAVNLLGGDQFRNLRVKRINRGLGELIAGRQVDVSATDLARWAGFIMLELEGTQEALGSFRSRMDLLSDPAPCIILCGYAVG
jgi:hypothetical protein